MIPNRVFAVRTFQVPRQLALDASRNKSSKTGAL